MRKPTKQQQDEPYLFSEAAREVHSFNYCAIRSALNVVGGKWKLLLLSYLVGGPKRYGELMRLIPEISEKMLIQELRELEADLILERKVYHQVPPKVEYFLTPHGQAIQPIVQSLLAWGEVYLNRPERLMEA
ncbi:MAG: helix-turn-helix transcriptional regulator [Ferruginibacter sp.]|nr:helix-turn-helix transcriptional regulator [Cytophagales bacterium]